MEGEREKKEEYKRNQQLRSYLLVLSVQDPIATTAVYIRSEEKKRRCHGNYFHFLNKK